MIDYKKLSELGIYGFHLNLIWWYNNKKYHGKFEVPTEEDAFGLGMILMDTAFCTPSVQECKVTIWNTFEKKWIHEWDSNKQRVANPKHRIFIIAGSRDCDGIYGYDVVSFETLKEAAEWEDEWFSSLEGPGGFGSVSAEEWENWERPEFRDLHAERMGY